MDIPQEVYAHEIIRYLPVNDILHLCQTSCIFHSICQDNSMWRYLIGRDFYKRYEGNDAQEQYWKEQRDILNKSIVDDTTDYDAIDLEDMEDYGFTVKRDYFEWRQPNFTPWIARFARINSLRLPLTGKSAPAMALRKLFSNKPIQLIEAVRIYEYYNGIGTAWPEIESIARQIVGLSNNQIMELKRQLFPPL